MSLLDITHFDTPNQDKPSQAAALDLAANLSVISFDVWDCLISCMLQPLRKQMLGYCCEKVSRARSCRKATWTLGLQK